MGGFPIPRIGLYDIVGGPLPFLGYSEKFLGIDTAPEIKHSPWKMVGLED